MAQMSNEAKEVKFVFQEWKSLLSKFKSDVDETLNVIRQDKREIQEIKREIYNRINKGQYMYDNDRIVISAPEIIIGNVDKSGQLKPGASRVVIRSNDIDLEGVGENGQVQTKATSIKQIAIDPGDDGLEEVVHDGACVVTQGRSIVIDSNDSINGIYTHAPEQKITVPGIMIHADHDLHIDSSVSLTELTDGISQKKSDTADEIAELTASANALELKMKEQLNTMQETLAQDKDLRQTDELTSMNLTSLDLLHLLLTNASTAFFNTVNDFLHVVSSLAEKKRQLTALDDISVLSKDEFEKQATGAKLWLNAEDISLSNRDGDNNQRTNEDAKISIKSKNIQISGTDDNGVTLSESVVDIWGENVNVFTNGVEAESDESHKYPAQGCVNVNSGCIKLMTYDLEGKQNEPMQPTELAEEGIVQILSKNIDLKGLDKEGKSVGHTTVVGKVVTVRSCDFNPDTMDVENVTEHGKIMIQGEKLQIGSREQGTKSVKVSGNDVLLLGTDKVYLHTRKDKHSLSLNNDDFHLRIFGKILFKKKKSKELSITDTGVKIKAPLTVEGSAEIQSVVAKDYLKGPNGEFGTPPIKSSSTVADEQEPEDKEEKKEKSTEVESNFSSVVKKVTEFLFPKKRR